MSEKFIIPEKVVLYCYQNKESGQLTGMIGKFSTQMRDIKKSIELTKEACSVKSSAQPVQFELPNTGFKLRIDSSEYKYFRRLNGHILCVTLMHENLDAPVKIYIRENDAYKTILESGYMYNNIVSGSYCFSINREDENIEYFTPILENPNNENLAKGKERGKIDAKQKTYNFIPGHLYQTDYGDRVVCLCNLELVGRYSDYSYYGNGGLKPIKWSRFKNNKYNFRRKEGDSSSLIMKLSADDIGFDGGNLITEFKDSILQRYLDDDLTLYIIDRANGKLRGVDLGKYYETNESTDNQEIIDIMKNYLEQHSDAYQLYTLYPQYIIDNKDKIIEKVVSGELSCLSDSDRLDRDRAFYSLCYTNGCREIMYNDFICPNHNNDIKKVMNKILDQEQAN